MNIFLHTPLVLATARFRGFACLGLQNVEGACKELKRWVLELGFVGGLINGATNGTYLDEPRFTPFWHTLEQLDVPLYLHPGLVSEHTQDFGGHPELEGAVWSWTCDTATHMHRLVFARVCADAPRRCALEAVGDEAVMFSTDYPYEDIQLAADWIENAAISEAQRIKVGRGNAKRVLRLE